MGNALRVAALATLVAGETDDPMRDPASWGAGQCVAYLFLQGEQSMALSDVWQEYLNSCPPGSYTVHAHLQHEAPFPVQDAQIVRSPVEGDLRYSWSMQDAMHKLFRSALDSAIGCKPVWLQVRARARARAKARRRRRRRLRLWRRLVGEPDTNPNADPNPPRSPAGLGRHRARAELLHGARAARAG